MFATDFLFDNQRASGLGVMICSFNGDMETVSGGEIEYNVVKTPNSDKFTFYGSQLNSPVEWNFSICKNPCVNKSPYFNQFEERVIYKWLTRTDGYKLFQFDQTGYEDIFYYVYINLSPHQENGKTIGFDLKATANCAYGFTNIIKKKAFINSSAPFQINVHSDINTDILPKVRLKGRGNFSVHNYRDYKDNILQNPILDKPLEFKNMSKEITMDSDTDLITGLSSPNDFNWRFMRLVDGANFISTTSASNIEFEIEYREPRLIRI